MSKLKAKDEVSDKVKKWIKWKEPSFVDQDSGRVKICEQFPLNEEPVAWLKKKPLSVPRMFCEVPAGGFTHWLHSLLENT